MALVERIVFTEAMMGAFARASRDRNPLHTDAAYAARTPFGFPVVYGVLGLLGALRNILRTMPIRITRLQVDFVGALYAGETYAVDVSPAGRDGFRITLLAGETPKQRIELGYEAWEPAGPQPGAEPAGLRQDPDDRDMASLSGRVLRQRYVPDAAGVAELLALLDLPASRLPDAQLAALLWSSYCVGMEIPGRQALYARLEAAFDTVVPASSQVDCEASVGSVDPVSAFVSLEVRLTGDGASVGALRLEALRRPEPVRQDVQRLVSGLQSVQPFAGRRVLVTGGSRGIGALLALGAGIAGAQVFVHYRQGRDEAEAVVARIREAGGQAEAVGGDLADAGLWMAIRRQVQKSGRGLDLVIHSAFTPILQRTLGELGAPVLQHDFERNVAAVVNGLQQLLPMLRPVRGAFVLASSVYVDRPPAGFGWYAAQKAALESLLAATAAENPGLACIALRLPRFLSDQTNVNFDPVPPADSIDVALAVLRSLRETPAGFHVLHPC